jgi:hypothetical protein
MVARAEQNATIDPPTKFDLVVGLCGFVGVITVIAVATGWL